MAKLTVFEVFMEPDSLLVLKLSVSITVEGKSVPPPTGRREIPVPDGAAEAPVVGVGSRHLHGR